MTDRIDIRESGPGDLAAIEALYPAAFPEEDLLPLVRALLAEGAGVLSLVATLAGRVSGHVIFTECAVAGGAARGALLGPLAVAPAAQRRGIGSALVREGLRRLEEDGVARVFVLGDPAYYARFGFATETEAATPYPIPEDWREAWRSLPLGADATVLRGTLTLPGPWRRPALWAP